MPVIALLTDFGLQDPFVGVMKGVIAGLAPNAEVIDLCHGVPPQDVRTGALFLKQSVPYFPRGTVFVAVIDPGVGSGRRALLARTRRHRFLAPDNGLLSWLPQPVIEWRAIEGGGRSLAGVSNTFHGRDVFAPAAARLAAGLGPSAMGQRIDDPVRLPWPKDEIVSTDRFGNAITSIERAVRSVRYRGKGIAMRRTYADARPGEALALVGSSGLLELAIRNGSFAARYNAKRGDKVDARG